MGIFDRLRNPSLLAFIKDQHLRELFTRKEFRISEEYVRREFFSSTEDDEVRNLSLALRGGELIGRLGVVL
jgi:hypothetical protein